MFEAVCESKFFQNCWLEYLYTTSQYDQDFLRTWYMGSALERRERKEEQEGREGRRREREIDFQNIYVALSDLVLEITQIYPFQPILFFGTVISHLD